MNTQMLGLACLVLGAGWWLWQRIGWLAPQDERQTLISHYLIVRDHVEKCGTDEQKAAVASLMPAMLMQEPAAK